jgi:filamentous hemagglutinin family protein
MLKPLAALLLVATLCVSPAFAQKKALFDNTHAQTAGNADWIIDTHQPVPFPDQSAITEATPENYWTGALSSWGTYLVKRGFTVATLTSAYGITYLNPSNPYDLSNYDILIVDEPNTVFTAAESTAIFNYVRDGGGLFAISDHNASDRNNDGFDSPHIWNLVDAQQLWGVHFGVTGDPNNSITQTSANVNVSPSDSIINGPAGVAPGIAFHAGTTMTLNTASNPTVTGDVWMTGQPQGSTTGGMVAHATYGNGRVVFVSDSSPADDGTGSQGTVFGGWAENADSLIFLNGTLWAARRSTASGDSIPPVVALTSPTGGESWAIGSVQAVTWSASDDVGVTSIDLACSTDGGATFPTVIASGLANSGSYAWTVSALPSNTARVRVTAHDAAGHVAADSSHANFSVTGWTITATAGANGTVTPAGAHGVADGATPVYAISANGGYMVADVLVNGSSVGAVTSYTFAAVHADQTISATFAPGGGPHDTYTWNQTGSAAWGTAGNWTPARTVPATDDVLIFNGGGAVTATGVPAQTIGELQVSGGSSVALQPGGAVTLTLAGTSGVGLDVAAGSSLILNGTSALVIAVGTGATGAIKGAVTMSGAAHRLLAASASALTIQSGASVTVGTGFTGNAFGTGVAPGALNSVVFQNGSLYVQQSGAANPFGATAPNSAVIFQPGSRFRLDFAATPSVSGRTYADFELNVASAISVSGGNAWSMDSVIVTQGTLNLGGLTGGGVLRGSIRVKSGATLTFNPAGALSLALTGTTAQNIDVQGTLGTNAASVVTINNPSGVTMTSAVTLGGTLAFTHGTVTTGASTLAILSGGNVTGASQLTGWVAGNLRRNVAAGSPAVKFDVGDSATYAPASLAMNGVVTAFDLAAATKTPDHPSLASSDLDGAKSVNRYWTLTPSGSPAFTSFDPTFTFAAADLDAGANPANFLMRRFSAGWFALSIGTRTASSTQATGVTAFGDFAIAELYVPTFTITASAGANGTITPSGAVSVVQGGAQSFTIAPADGYAIADVNVDGGSVGAVASYDFTNVTSDHTIVATFQSVTAGLHTGSAPVLSLARPSPNPSRGGVGIAFSMPRDGIAQLAILDIGGRIIAHDDLAASAGTHDWSWNGRLDTGADTPPGLYFVRLVTPFGTRMERLIHLR